LDAFEGGAVDEAAHVGLGGGDFALVVDVEGGGETTEGFAGDGFGSGSGPFDFYADTAVDGVFSGPVETEGPGGGFAVVVVEVEVGAVVEALGGELEALLEEGLEGVGGGGVDVDGDGDGFAVAGGVDGVSARRHVLDVGRGDGGVGDLGGEIGGGNRGHGGGGEIRN
jgi:hypothetical protein